MFGLRPFIRFGTEVISASFDESSKTWRLRTRSSDGEQSLEADAIVSAVGQLNRPKLPEIGGRDAFRGAAFHSAQWRHDLDFTGKRVVVIGTGASAVQFIPVIAEQAAAVTILQRTANWFFPAPLYHERVADGLEWLFQHVPTYAHWYRFWLFWRGTEALLPACQVDPSWEPQERSVSAANDFFRELLAAYIQAEFADRPDLFEKVLPTYPPASKRIVVDNGTWARTLKRPNVHLVTEKIESITAGGVVTADGVEHAADIIVYATGFQASRFLTPVKVLGRDGIDMHRQWDGNARAYLGITVPNFPNFFFLYGPNTNIVVNGSIIYFSECEVNYVVGCVKLLLESRRRAMDPRRDVHDAYNEKIDAGNKMMTWGASSVNSWYKSDSGRVAQNWPFGLLEYWEQTREPDPNDYELL